MSKAPDREPIFHVDKIVAHKIRQGKRYYQVKWEGFGPSENTWEPEENFIDRKTVDLYERRRTSVASRRQRSRKVVSPSEMFVHRPSTHKSNVLRVKRVIDKSTTTTSALKMEEPLKAVAEIAEVAIQRTSRRIKKPTTRQMEHLELKRLEPELDKMERRERSGRSSTSPGNAKRRRGSVTSTPSTEPDDLNTSKSSSTTEVRRSARRMERIASQNASRSESVKPAPKPCTSKPPCVAALPDTSSAIDEFAPDMDENATMEERHALRDQFDKEAKRMATQKVNNVNDQLHQLVQRMDASFDRLPSSSLYNRPDLILNDILMVVQRPRGAVSVLQYKCVTDKFPRYDCVPLRVARRLYPAFFTTHKLRVEYLCNA